MDKNSYIFGIRAIIEAIEAGKTIDKILIRRDLGGELASELNALVKDRNIPVQRVPLEKLNRITRKNHQGAIAMLSPVEYYRLDQLIPTIYESGKNPFFIILDGLTDTRNFGAIARTASCAGADAIIIPERNSVSVTPDAVKTSAGALMSLPVCRVKSVAEAVKELQANGIKVVAASEKATAEYDNCDYTGPIAIVMGAEDVGISDDVLRICDEIVAIPMTGPIASLNVSVAAGIVIYAVVRSRRS